jgi:hypothetical protein
MLSSRQAQQTLAQLLCLCLLCCVDGGCSDADFAAQNEDADCVKQTSNVLYDGRSGTQCSSSYVSGIQTKRNGGFAKILCGEDNGQKLVYAGSSYSTLLIKYWCSACAGPCDYREWIYGREYFQGSKQVCSTHDPCTFTGQQGTCGDCTWCEAGKYSEEGEGLCKDCLAGKVQPNSGQGSCIDCAAGWSSNSLRTECSQYYQGKYDDGSRTCKDCPIGYYQPYWGMSGVEKCLACPQEHILVPQGIMCVFLVRLVFISRSMLRQSVNNVRQVRTHQQGGHLALHVIMVRCNQIWEVLPVTRD